MEKETGQVSTSFLRNGYRDSLQEIERGVCILAAHIHPGPRFGMGGFISILPYTPKWCGQRQLYLLLYLI